LKRGGKRKGEGEKTSGISTFLSERKKGEALNVEEEREEKRVMISFRPSARPLEGEGGRKKAKNEGERKKGDLPGFFFAEEKGKGANSGGREKKGKKASFVLSRPWEERKRVVEEKGKSRDDLVGRKER